MPIVAPAGAAGRAAFRPVPWHDDHPDRLELDRRLPPDHLARRIAAAVDRLDLQPLGAAYAGRGSAAYPPALLLRVALYEARAGCQRPAQWHRDARGSDPVRWLLRGCKPSRSAWYAFRDRAGPLLPGLHQQVLALAVAGGLTPGTRGAQDGTAVAANASRRRLVNGVTLRQRV